MAEYVVAFVLDKIAGYLIEEAESFSGLGVHVEWIEAELRRMQCFLKDAEMKQDGDERVKNWVADIRNIAYDTEDLVDLFILKVAQKRSGSMFFLSVYTFLNELIFRRNVSKQIQRIKQRIHEVKDSRSTYGIENIGRTSFASNRLQEKRRSSPFGNEEDVVGLEEDIRSLESRLIQGESRRAVISIVGMAGLGKTTLAKKVYLSCDIKKHFECCAWVYVSQEYRARDTLLQLAKKVMGFAKEDLGKMNNEDLVETLAAFLGDKRYLIVLDDIWKYQVWDDLRPAFPETSNGSRIVLTTRFKDVVLYADLKSPPHEPSLLDDEHSWELFCKKACLEWNSQARLAPWCQELGEQMVKRCGGLPLAIVVLGGLLSRKEATYSEWLKVLQSLHWQLRQEPTHCEEILALSYSDLPYYLKSCFLYLGLFPEDFEISARRLILLWIAEGFVQPRGQEQLEDVAEDYLEELIGRSMVQVAKRKSDGRIKACRIHDLLRELSISKAKEDQFFDIIYGGDKFSTLTRARRLVIHFGVPLFTKNAPKFRSLLCFDLNESVFQEFKKFKLLRVLDLEGIHIPQLDSAVGDLIQLRYLGLRGTWLKELPSSVRYLTNLQTLDFRSTLINPTPTAIWKLQKLRHLYFNELKEMVINPPKNPTLANLQSLQGLCIGPTSSIEHGLDNLINIRELGLHGNLHVHQEALAKWLYKNKNLECLKLQARSSFDDITNTGIPKLMTFSSHIHLYKLHLGGFISKLLEIEDFPPNLTELSLNGSFLMEDPMPKLEKLPNLRVLKLKESSCLGKQLVCSSGGFPQLQILKLCFLTLRTWRIEDGALSNLRQLEIVECRQMKIVPRGLKPVSTLCDLKLGFLPRDMELKVQEREGENWYRIQLVLPI